MSITVLIFVNQLHALDVDADEISNSRRSLVVDTGLSEHRPPLLSEAQWISS